jgi:hypothetical protein
LDLPSRNSNRKTQNIPMYLTETEFFLNLPYFVSSLKYHYLITLRQYFQKEKKLALWSKNLKEHRIFSLHVEIH